MAPRSFILSDGTKTVHASGATRYFDDCSAAIAELRSNHPITIVGALPFHATAAAALFTPRTLWHTSGAFSSSGHDNYLPQVVHKRCIPSPEEHMERVTQAITQIRQGNLHKVVLSRAEHYLFSADISPEQVLERFMRNSKSGFGHLVRIDDGAHAPAQGRFFVGSSPELLILKKGSCITSHPLAGTIPRSRDRDIDQQRAEALCQSEKDISEHRFVTAEIKEKLAPLCRTLNVPDRPSLTSTSHTWHLGTVIDGELKDPNITALELAQLLHPTAAVNGAPAQSAAALLADEEPNRGFYAGAIGWSDSSGDGHWRVGIRSVELQGNRAIACAGGGIVADSRPTAELRETEAKLGPARDAIGI